MNEDNMITFNIDGIKERLIRLDEDASLLIDDNNRYRCIIVGGSALILMGYSERATHDIDLINYYPNEIKDLLIKYDINSNASTYIENFPEDYNERIQPVIIPTKKIDFYTISLEDLIISKLNAGRNKDINDITTPSVLRDIDWILLDKLVKEIVDYLLNDRTKNEFNHTYKKFVNKYKVKK
jgi:hypothetical protein